MHIDEGDELFLNPTGGMGGKKEGSDTSVTHTTTNPVVPEDMKGIADALNAISGGMLGAPVNFGATGLDAPKAGPLIPEGSMGNMYASPGFASGFNRRNVMGMGRPPPGRGFGRGTPMPRSYGDMFSMTPPRYSVGSGGSSPGPGVMGGGQVPTNSGYYSGGAGSNQSLQQFLASIGSSGSGGGAGWNNLQAEPGKPIGGQG
jgi:hypothetical protein